MTTALNLGAAVAILLELSALRRAFGATGAAAGSSDQLVLASSILSWLLVGAAAWGSLTRGAFDWIAFSRFVQGVAVLAVHGALVVFYIGGGALLIVPIVEALYVLVLFNPAVRTAFPASTLRGAGWLLCGLSAASVAVVALSLIA